MVKFKVGDKVKRKIDHWVTPVDCWPAGIQGTVVNYDYSDDLYCVEYETHKTGRFGYYQTHLMEAGFELTPLSRSEKSNIPVALNNWSKQVEPYLKGKRSN